MLRFLLPAMAIGMLIGSSLTAQTITFDTSSANIGGNTRAFVIGASPTLPCPLPMEMEDSIAGIAPFGLTGNALIGGNYADVTSLVGTCPTSGEADGFVLITQVSPSKIGIKWDVRSEASYSCNDNLCPWTANAFSTVAASIGFVIEGVPAGRKALIVYSYSLYSFVGNRPEAVVEDTAYVVGVNLSADGSDLLPGNFDITPDRTGRALYNSLWGQLGSKLVGDTVGTIGFSMGATAYAKIAQPGRFPPNERYDLAVAEYYGFMDIEVLLVDTLYVPGPSVPLPAPTAGLLPCATPDLYFSVAIGGDNEYSDPMPGSNGTLDPADIYHWRTGNKVWDDTTAFGHDPSPNTVSVAPACGNLSFFDPGVVDSVALEHLDIDGIDLIDIDLANTTFGPGNRIPYRASDCIHEPRYMLLSFDEAPTYPFVGNGTGTICNIPTVPDFTLGTTAGKDEVLTVNIGINPQNGSWNVTPLGSFSETQVATTLAPVPDVTTPGKLFNDDVDALDNHLPGSNCGYQYLTVDHQARYTQTAAPLLPGAIYQVSSGSLTPVIVPALHLGINNPEVDIDAMEFAWLPDPLTGQLYLALVFSVDAEDFYANGDQQDTLQPAMLYASFLDGNFWALTDAPITYSAPDSTAVAPMNIDAITFTCNYFLPDSSGFFAPANPPISTGLPSVAPSGITQLSVFPNPNSGSFVISFGLQHPANVDVAIIDLSGKLAWSHSYGHLGTGKRDLQIANDATATVSNGLYLIKVTSTSENGTFSHYTRVVINR